jgi:hypothetical protein
VLLLLNKAELVVPTYWKIFFFAETDLWWTLLAGLALTHFLTMWCVWWLRNDFYRRMTTRSASDSAVTA